MAEDIPSVDLRVRRFLERYENRMPQLLKDFHKNTELVQPHNEELFKKGMAMARSPMDAFIDDSSGEMQPRVRHDGLKLEPEEFAMVVLDREEVKPQQITHRNVLPVIWRNPLPKWKHLPWQMWKLVVFCAIGASVQGWDQAAVNGAQLWYTAAFQEYIVVPDELKSTYRPSPGIVGLISGAPYMCCVLSCWLSPPLNAWLGRRGTIFWCAIFSIVFALLQGFAQSWQQMFAYRFLMGLGIGPKSVTIPIYAAECAPPNVRGSLVMFWQAWTAFGIMAGCLAGLALQNLGSITSLDVCPQSDAQKLLSWQCSKNWRLIMASPAVLPIILAAYIYTCPESPRWCIKQGHRCRELKQPRSAKYYYQKAWKGLKALSRTKVLAARDMFSQYVLLQEERDVLHTRQDQNRTRSWFKRSELFGQQRNRRAILASLTCMFAQQFCGVNLIVYYSNIVFLMIHFNVRDPTNGELQKADSATMLKISHQALGWTAGFGVINFIFAAPAFFTIDTVGRRTLLLCTFPFMAIAHFITMAAFALESKTGPYLALAGMYVFGIAYSIGEGPVPFVYAAESMPLYIRELGMGLVVSINWLFNWLIAFTGPWFFGTFKPAGTFAWYAGWCIILWFMIFFFVPETRMLSLEDLDKVFEKPAAVFRNHAWQSLRWQLYLTDHRPPRLYENTEEDSREEMSELIRRRRATSDQAEESSAAGH